MNQLGSDARELMFWQYGDRSKCVPAFIVVNGLRRREGNLANNCAIDFGDQRN